MGDIRVLSSQKIEEGLFQEVDYVFIIYLKKRQEKSESHITSSRSSSRKKNALF